MRPSAVSAHSPPTAPTKDADLMPLLGHREAFRHWLNTAPLPVVLSITITAFSVLGSWVWVIAGDVRNQQTLTAVAAEKALAAHTASVAVEARLVRMEDKLDHILGTVAELTAEHAAETRRASRRTRSQMK